MRLTRAGSPVVSRTGGDGALRLADIVRMPREIVLQAVGHHLGLRQKARERRQVAAEQVLDQRKVRAAEDRPMRRRAAGLRQQRRRRPALTRASSSASGRAVLDGAGKLRAGLLHDRDLRAALADFLRVGVRGDRARGAEHGDDVGVVLLRILRRGHRPRRLRGGLDRRRDDAEDVVARPSRSPAASPSAACGRPRRSPYCSRAAPACSRAGTAHRRHGASASTISSEAGCRRARGAWSPR